LASIFDPIGLLQIQQVITQAAKGLGVTVISAAGEILADKIQDCGEGAEVELEGVLAHGRSLPRREIGEFSRKVKEKIKPVWPPLEI
jgi:hypothetical protein